MRELENMGGRQFGYPDKGCNKCFKGCELKVDPFFRSGGNIRLMLIGQDPTIFRKPERVTEVLMLNSKNSQLFRWLKETIFGEENFNSMTIYATNLVKCSFSKPPSTTEQGSLKFLKPFFAKCCEYLKEEVKLYKPTLIMTFGEPTHILFRTILDDSSITGETMQEAFSGKFVKASINGYEFYYSPCLHISTFRVAEVYGDRVKQFKGGLMEFFKG